MDSMSHQKRPLQCRGKLHTMGYYSISVQAERINNIIFFNFVNLHADWAVNTVLG